jgi:hypothetical protein
MGHQQPSPQEEQCLKTAFEQYLRTLNNVVAEYSIPGVSPSELQTVSEFLQSSLLSRHFYRVIWTKSITGQQWKKFCQSYIEAIKSFDACPNSTTKTQYLLPVGLTDYICRNRVQDFSANAACLHEAVLNAAPICANRCSEFENGSNIYSNPSESGFSPQGDMTPYLIMDCEYLNCTANCNRPFFERNCSSVGDLQLDTLHVMQTVNQEMHEPPEFRKQVEKSKALGFDVSSLLPFPAQCRELAKPVANFTIGE